MPAQQNQGFEDLRNTITDVLRIVRYRWRVALVGLALVSSAAFWYSRHLPREYAATTLFERRDDAVLQNLITTNSPYSFEHLKTTIQLDTTGSRALARALVRAGLLPESASAGTGALDEYERGTLERIVGRYGLKAAVSMPHSSPNLDTIQLQCLANDPRVAREVVIALRDNYITDIGDRIAQILGRTREFFTIEVDRLQSQTAAADARLRDGFEAYPGLDPTDISAVGSRLETFRAQRSIAAQRKAELEAQITAREQFLLAASRLYAERLDEPTSQPSGGGEAVVLVDPAINAAIEDVRKQIFELMAVKRMTSEHPEVRRLVSRLEAMEELRGTLATVPAEQTQPAVAAGLSPVQREWQSQKLRVDLELDALRRQLENAQKDFAEIDGRTEQFAALYDRVVNQGEDLRKVREQRTATVNELGVWQGYMSRLERVLSAESGDRGTRFTLIEEPQDNALPIKPRLTSILMVCCGLGLAAAALVVAFAELFDRSFRSLGHVTRTLGVPVLECISVIPTPRERRRRFLSRAIWTPVLTVLVLTLLTTGLLAYSSLARPALYQSTIQKFDRLFNAISIGEMLEDGAA